LSSLWLPLTLSCAAPIIQVQTPLTAAASRVDPTDFAVLKSLASAARIPLQEVDVRLVGRLPVQMGEPLRSPAVAWVLRDRRRVVGLYLHGGTPAERCTFPSLCRLGQSLGGRADPVFPGLAQIAQLTALRFLHLHTFSVPSLAGIEKLGELHRLVVTSCGLRSVEGLGRLRRLTWLDVSHNELRALNALAGLHELVALIAVSNRLEHLPDLSGLARLKTFDLSFNRLQRIDFVALSRAGALARMTELRFTSNRLRDVRGIGAFSELALLDLSNNRIESLAGVEGLARLKTLIVSNNRLGRLEGLERLPALETVNARGNRITRFAALRLPKSLRSLDLSDNPIPTADGLEQLFLPLRRLQQIDLVGTPAVEQDRAALKALKARHRSRIYLRICLVIDGMVKDC
jgi:hypothetical protein